MASRMAEIVHRAPKFTDRFVDIRQIDPRNTDEVSLTVDVPSDRVVISARHRDPEIALDFIDQRPVIGDEDLVVETFAQHDLAMHIKIPTRFAEGVNFFAVAKIGGGVAGKFLFVQTKISAVVRAQTVELDEAAAVKQNFEALSRQELSLFMLAATALFAAALLRFFIELAQLGEIIDRGHGSEILGGGIDVTRRRVGES